MGDTSTVKYLDSSIVIKNGGEHIIIIQDLKKETKKQWYESVWVSSLLIPIIVAAVVAMITNWFNKRKEKVEIDKLKAETANLKKSFQPVVIGTLQSIQDKIITSKIEALKNLVQVRNEFISHEQEYFEGEPVSYDLDDFLDALFYNFSQNKYDDFVIFHDRYSYLFPDSVFVILKNLSDELFQLNETKKAFNSIDDPDIEPAKSDREKMKKIIKIFEESILAIRKDCHLDTSFIHDFIEQNKK